MIEEYTHQELVAVGSELLPSRQALTLFNLTLNLTNIVALNPAIALNVLTVGSSATAIAGQIIGL